MGRRKGPVKYSRRILEKARAYVENYEDHGHIIPSVIGLSKVLGVPRRTLYRWKDDEAKPAFAEVMVAVVENQEFTLIQKALAGEINSNIAKLALGKHGYHDNKNHTSSDGSMSPKPTEIKLVAPDVKR